MPIENQLILAVVLAAVFGSGLVGGYLLALDVARKMVKEESPPSQDTDTWDTRRP